MLNKDTSDTESESEKADPVLPGVVEERATENGATKKEANEAKKDAEKEAENSAESIAKADAASAARQKD